MTIQNVSSSYGNDHYTQTPGENGRVTEGFLKTMDTFGGLLAAFMTLGPLAATALFAH